MRRRKEFEDAIRMQRQHLGNYIKCAACPCLLACLLVCPCPLSFRLVLTSDPPGTASSRRYASWEEQQQEFERARSVFERAIDVDYRSVSAFFFFFFFFSLLRVHLA